MARCSKCKEDVGCSCGLKEGGLCSKCLKEKKEAEAKLRNELASKKNEQK